MAGQNPYAQTIWDNPTSHTCRFQLFEGPGEINEIVIDPKGSIGLPSKHDNAIRTVRDGVVVGGLAPLLVPRDREGVPVHAAITRGAAEGDREREALHRTGSTGGSLSLDATTLLQAQNDQLAAKVKQQEDEMRQQGDFFAAKLRELEARMAAPDVPAPPPDKPTSAAKGATGGK